MATVGRRSYATAPAGADAFSRLGLRLMWALAGIAAAGIAADRLAATLLPRLDSAGPLAGVLAACVVGVVLVGRVFRPVLRARAELQVRYEAALAEALQDPLTGLGNHRAFQEELDRQVEQSQRYSVPLALVLIDIDEFKAINDAHGHAAGDRVLRRFGHLLATSIRRVDRPFRVGGDEFAVLLPHTDAEGARIVARRLLAMALQPPLRGQAAEPLSFSAGLSSVPDLAEGRAQLYSQADAALYAAKRGGRTDIVVFDPASEAASSAGDASAAVAEVIARGQLRPVYQPIVEINTGRVLGVEGLIRPVAPAPFSGPAALFEAAESSGRVTALDLACVETIVAGAARQLGAGQFLSVNLSPQTIEAPEFSTSALMGILARHAFAADRLVVELTERQEIHDVDRVRLKLETCRSAGIRIAADDIGAGNSGLRLLAEIRFDILKVDLSLVRRSVPGGLSSAVVGSVVELASRTGALVIAEGVEHASELAQLAELDVRAAQGYFLGRPGPLGEAAPVEASGMPSPLAAWRQSIGLPTPSVPR